MSETVTTSKGKFRIGLQKWLGTGALIVLGVVGARGAFDSITRNPTTGALTGTNTGSVLTLNGAGARFYDKIPLVMTGGHLQDTAAIARMADYRITGSGVVTTAAIAWVKAPAAGTSDIAISKCVNGTVRTAASGTLLPNGNNKANSSGSGLQGLVGTGAVRVNGADCVVVKVGNNPTSSGSGYLIIEGLEDPSE